MTVEQLLAWAILAIVFATLAGKTGKPPDKTDTS